MQGSKPDGGMELALPPTFATEVFINQRGFIAIRQLDERGSESLVELTMTQAYQVSEALRRIIERERQQRPTTVPDFKFGQD